MFFTKARVYAGVDPGTRGFGMLLPFVAWSARMEPKNTLQKGERPFPGQTSSRQMGVLLAHKSCVLRLRPALLVRSVVRDDPVVRDDQWGCYSAELGVTWTLFRMDMNLRL